MTFQPLRLFLLTGLCIAATIGSSTSLPAAAAKDRPDIYDGKADGAKQVAAAVELARQEHKNVLLQFGANWCGWCHKLHDLCASDQQIAAELKQHYVVVLIDVNKGNNEETNQRFGHPTKLGLPVLVVLDGTGKQLTTKNSGDLEEGDRHSPQKVLEFLQAWAPKA